MGSVKEDLKEGRVSYASKYFEDKQQSICGEQCDAGFKELGKGYQHTN